MEILLISPEWKDGVLNTDKGGKVIGTDFAIQADCFYIEKKEKEGIFRVSASGNLFFKIGGRYFSGKKLEYDLIEKNGIVECPVLQEGKWLLKATLGLLHADGSFSLYGSTFTTSISERPEWCLCTKELSISQSKELMADRISLRLGDCYLFALPPVKLHLDALSSHPFRYYAKWGGHEGPRMGIMYEFYSDSEKKILGRFDSRLKGGFGGGFEAHYKSELSRYQGTNYIARDFEVDKPKIRFRFQGIFNKTYVDNKTNIFLSYDKISDSDMPADYTDKGIFIENAEKTELLVRREEPWAIFLFATRVRLNSFETVKQELPSLECYLKPFQWKNWIFQNRIKGCYLDYVYANSLKKTAKDYQAVRILGNHRQLLPFSFGPIKNLLSFEEHSLYYSRSPEGAENWTGLFVASLKSSIIFEKKYHRFTHAVEPFIEGKYATFPSTPPNRHYIFDIDDGIYRLHEVKLGITQNFLRKSLCCWEDSPISLDLYTIIFPDTNTLPVAVPNAYCDMKWLATDTLRIKAGLNWSLWKNRRDAIFAAVQWTLHENHAISIEWRDRSRRVLRKGDPTNFFLESYRPFKELEDSPLSDRRDILLARGFWRFHPLWSLEWEMRFGWHRPFEKAWHEIGVEMVGRLPSYWNVVLAYQKRQGRDNRFSLSVSLDLQQPKQKCNIDPCLLEY